MQIKQLNLCWHYFTYFVNIKLQHEGTSESERDRGEGINHSWIVREVETQSIKRQINVYMNKHVVAGHVHA